MAILIDLLFVFTGAALALFGYWFRGWRDRRRADRMYRNICAEIDRREADKEWPEVIGG